MRSRPRAGDCEQIVHAERIGEDSEIERPAVPGTPHHRPILGIGPHVGRGGDAVGEQNLLGAGQRAVAHQRRRRRHRALDQGLGGVDEDSARRAPRPFDPAAGRRLGRGGDIGLAHRRRIRPAGMAVDPLEPDRPVADRGVELGRGGEAAEVPALLVPAPADDPARRRIGGGIGGDPLLRLGQGRGVGQIELERAHAELHDMAVGVDQAGEQGPAAAVEQEAGAVRPGVAALVELAHPPVVADPHAVEPEQMAVLADRVAVDIVDQYVGRGGGGDEHRQSEEDVAQHERGDKACLRLAPALAVPSSSHDRPR
jgi:hypothetical protein